MFAEVSDGSLAEDVDVVDDDGWRFFDGDLEGERIPDDEMHGIGTQELEEVDGFLTSPAKTISPGVT